MKVLVLFYSTYGHVYRLAQAIADGAREVAGAEVVLKRVPESVFKKWTGVNGGVKSAHAIAKSLPHGSEG